MSLSLFNEPLPKGGQEPDDTQIRQFILYFSEEEWVEMKKLVKKGIAAEFQDERFEKGNASDLILISLRKNYGENS